MLIARVKRSLKTPADTEKLTRNNQSTNFSDAAKRDPRRERREKLTYAESSFSHKILLRFAVTYLFFQKKTATKYHQTLTTLSLFQEVQVKQTLSGN